MRRGILITNGGVPEYIGQILGYAEHEEFSENACIRVTNIGAKWWVCQGDDVFIFVTVCNDGAYQKTIDLVLEDIIDNVIIDARTFTLSPQASEVVISKWKTKGLRLGNHVLYAQVKPSPEQSDYQGSSQSARAERAYREVALAEANQILGRLTERQ